MQNNSFQIYKQFTGLSARIIVSGLFSKCIIDPNYNVTLKAVLESENEYIWLMSQMTHQVIS